eukprot:GHUV01044057.1.p1 GENE.GHUV01044057.1~~GHUV01044057.1.p1  ORF type:complete len:101 (-),score=8.17 GHUV01044057.1:192-494(-)
MPPGRHLARSSSNPAGAISQQLAIDRRLFVPSPHPAQDLLSTAMRTSSSQVLQYSSTQQRNRQSSVPNGPAPTSNCSALLQASDSGADASRPVYRSPSAY